jgi:hypothetical protein
MNRLAIRRKSDNHHSSQSAQPLERNIRMVQPTARVRVTVLHSFLNFSISPPVIHLFKLIDLYHKLLIWY